MSDDIIDALRAIGQLKDQHINLAKAAILLGAFDSPGISLDRYENHVIKLCDEVIQRHALLISEGANDDAATQLASLKHVMVDLHDYRGNWPLLIMRHRHGVKFWCACKII